MYVPSELVGILILTIQFNLLLCFSGLLFRDKHSLLLIAFVPLNSADKLHILASIGNSGKNIRAFLFASLSLSCKT